MNTTTPVKHWPVLLSVLAALSLEVAPLPAELATWRPPWLALVVIYWILNHPRRYGLVMAWLTGLVLDILRGDLLGQQALALTTAAWITLRFHLRLRVFPAWQQTMAIAGVVLAHEFIVFWVDGVTGVAVLSWQRLGPLVTAALAWPVIAWLLDRVQAQLRLST